jgi:hypothetical protein
MQAIRAMCVEKLSMPLTPKLEPKGVAVSLAWKQFNLRMTRDATSLVLESPTGGHKVECAKAAQAGEVLEIDLRVETPGKDQIVTQAMVEHAIELPQAQIARAKIRISLRERGAHYLVEPAFEEVGELRLR